MRLHHLLALNSWLAICILFLPISWGHVGEQGYVNYGPDVPDVYILGCYILGKDTQFWGISFAWKFQLIGILSFLYLEYTTWRAYVKDQPALFKLFGAWFLLLLFPVWIQLYIGGVQNNSDGAFLQWQMHAGWYFYLLILVLQTIVLFYSIRSYFTLKTTDSANFSV
jgi:hypothetical protein